jgi:hypothetical protein
MNVKDHTAMRGVFNCRVCRKGEIAGVFGNRNMIVDGARFQMARLIAEPSAGRRVRYIAFGTNGDAATPDDTGITEPVMKEIDSFEYPEDGQARFNWTLGSTEANGKAIMEFGLVCDNGTLFARYVREQPLNKDSDFSLEGDWTIIF